MSAQTYLTENPPRILDATCSFSHAGQRTPRWPAHASIRMDVRKVVKPDLVADARFLPFRDGVFSAIYCDPPHLMRKGVSSSLIARRRLEGRMRPDPWTLYGSWPSRNDWLDFVRRANPEFARCLNPKGRLHYKVTDNHGKRDTKAADVETPHFEVESRVITKSRSNLGNGPPVHWLTMKPKPTSEKHKEETKN